MHPRVFIGDDFVLLLMNFEIGILGITKREEEDETDRT
jgi:hypothetical protein